ncbi:MAG: hypothetical protein Kow0074_06720 [Candidatus Zixiibacteriota bacterium]
MKSFSDIESKNLVWRQPKNFRMEYELMDGKVVVATLAWEKPMGSLAHAVTADGEWTFKRGGFLRPHVNVRIPGQSDDLARIEINLSGTGTLRFTDGAIYRWVSTSFWTGSWEFVTDDKTPLVRFRNPQMLGKAKGDVILEDEASENTRTPMLACLGWYLLILMAADTVNQNVTV